METLRYFPNFVNQVNIDGDTPLHVAAMHGHEDVAELLASYQTCALVGEAAHQEDRAYLIRNRAGDTPFHAALRYGHLTVADRLLTLHPGLCSQVNNVTCENPLHLVLKYCSGFLSSSKLTWPDKGGLSNLQDGHLLTSERLCFSKSGLLQLFDKAVSLFTHGQLNACLHDRDGLTPLHIAARNGYFRALDIILEYCPQSTEVCDPRGRNLLHYMKLSDYQELKFLFQLPPIFAIKDMKDHEGNTPAHSAFENGNFALLKVLYETGAYFFHRNNAGVTVEDLIEPDKSSLNKMDTTEMAVLNKMYVKGVTMIGNVMCPNLYKAAVEADIEVFDRVTNDLGNGFLGDVNAYFLRQTADGRNIIHIALHNEKDEADTFVEEALKRFPSLILQADSNGDTPLHHAVKWFASCNILQYMVDDYVKAAHDITAGCTEISSRRRRHLLTPWKLKNSEGNVPMHEALRYNNVHAAKVLLDTDPDAAFHVNDAGETPLHVFARYSSYPVSRVAAEYSKDKGISLDFLKELIEKNISATFMRDSEGLTPLMRAAKHGRVKVVKILLKHCPQSAHLQDHKGRTFLHLQTLDGAESCEGSNGKSFKVMAKQLFKHAEVDVLRSVKDYDGNTPLHYALKTGNSFTAKELIRRYFKNKGKHAEFFQNNDGQQIFHLMESQLLTNEVLDFYHKKTGGSFSFKSSYGIRKEHIKDSIASLSVIAGLLTTITFAAAFQVPGGVDNSKGSPLFLGKAAFLVFLIADALGMCCSTVVLFSLLWVMGASRTRDALVLLDISIFLLQSSFYATLLAFMTGVYVTTARKKMWLATFVCVICSIATIITWRSCFHFLVKHIADLKVKLSVGWEVFVKRFWKPMLLKCKSFCLKSVNKCAGKTSGTESV